MGHQSYECSADTYFRTFSVSAKFCSISMLLETIKKLEPLKGYSYSYLQFEYINDVHFLFRDLLNALCQTFILFPKCFFELLTNI